MTKLSHKKKKSKPRNKVETSMKKEVLENKKIYKEYPRSYRFDTEMMDLLKSTLHRMNQISPKKVSEARLVKALIILSQEMDEETLMRGLKKVW